jgi:hypothetical protein
MLSRVRDMLVHSAVPRFLHRLVRGRESASTSKTPKTSKDDFSGPVACSANEVVAAVYGVSEGLEKARLILKVSSSRFDSVSRTVYATTTRPESSENATEAPLSPLSPIDAIQQSPTLNAVVDSQALDVSRQDLSHPAIVDDNSIALNRSSKSIYHRI